MGRIALETPNSRKTVRMPILRSPYRPDKRRCTCGSSGYQEILQRHCESSLPIFPEPGCGQGRGAGGRGWPPAPSAPGSGVRTGTPGSQHQLKAVKVNEGRRGVWHRSTQAHKGGFSKSRESSNRRTPGGRLSRRGSYLGSAFGAAAFPGGDKARGGQGKASDPDGALPILREPPSSRPRPDAEERSSEPAQRGPRARRHRLARRCL